MVLTTRSSATKPQRVRRAPKLPDFVLEERPRTTICKKPRPKPSREKKKQVVVVEEEVEEEDQEEEEQGKNKQELDALIRGLASEFDASVQPENDLLRPEDLLDPEDLLLMPQFDPDFGPRATGPWTPAEDAVLMSAVKEGGAKNWSIVARHLPGRIGKQCRERWHNHLNPNICKLAWTEREDMIIQMGVARLGHKWSEIALQLPGRTDNAVKNRYNARIKKLGGGATILEEAPRVSDEDFMHELVRRNVLAEEGKTPGKFSPNQIEALSRGNTQIVDTPGCRWSNEEHARLALAIPKDVLVDNIDWVKASRAVPTRSALSCRRHWAAFLRGGWKPAAFMGMELDLDLELEPTPEPEFDVDAVFETLNTHNSLLVQHANDPNLELMAIETYSEGSSCVTWSRSSVLVVGKPGFSFRFHTPGTELPPPPPPPSGPPLPVVAEKVLAPGEEAVTPSAKQLETTALFEWMKQKELAYKAAQETVLAQQLQVQEEKMQKSKDEKVKRSSRAKNQQKELKKMNTCFHARKPQVPMDSKAHWLRTLDVLAPASPPLVAVAVQA